MIARVPAILALLALVLGPAHVRGQSVPAETYRRAEQYLPWNIGRHVENRDVVIHWVSNEILVYRTGNADAWRFIAFDLNRRAKSPAFDHGVMAQALGIALGRSVSPYRLPISAIASARGDRFDILADRVSFQCDLARRLCTRLEQTNVRAVDSALSNGTWSLFRRGDNLWRRALGTAQELQVTYDGGPFRRYGARPGTDNVVSLSRSGQGDAPVGVLSPDGSHVVVQVIDERDVPALQLVQPVPEDGTVRPRLWTYRRPFPGDRSPQASLAVINLASGSVTSIRHQMTAQLGGPIPLGQIGWSADGRALYILDHQDEYRRLALLRADLGTGEVTTLVAEERKTNILAMGVLRPIVLGSGEIIWPSERSGWMHLYLYDRDGHLKRRLTDGSWVVREVLDVDETGRDVLFAAGGRVAGQDPYFRQIYRVGLDNAHIAQVSDGNADHAVEPTTQSISQRPTRSANAGISPDGRHFIDSASAPDQPTRTILRSRSGHSVEVLEVARVNPALQYREPEPFAAVAADGETRLFGTLFVPSDFDPRRRYPLVDLMYPGPQSVQVGKRYLEDVNVMPLAQAIAELGLVVVAIDGRGTPLRSRAFREASFGRLGTAGFLEDHVAVIRQLADQRPYINVDRVGAVGHSAGAFAAVHALCDYPHIFRVAVASSGVHDLRSYSRDWGVKYQGPYDPNAYITQTVFPNIDSCNGNLLLSTGDMDDNVHPANTFRLAEALINANKDFDLIVIPNENHNLDRNPYYIRRMWDFLVRHLLDSEPPRNFTIAAERP